MLQFVLDFSDEYNRWIQPMIKQIKLFHNNVITSHKLETSKTSIFGYDVSKTFVLDKMVVSLSFVKLKYIKGTNLISWTMRIWHYSSFMDKLVMLFMYGDLESMSCAWSHHNHRVKDLYHIIKTNQSCGQNESWPLLIILFTEKLWALSVSAQFAIWKMYS